MEKYIDLTVYGAKQDIQRYLVNGWILKEYGATLAILEKPEKTYSILASEFCENLKNLVNNKTALNNFELYLSMHFERWMQEHANTPGKLNAEIKMFSEVE